MRAVFLLLGPFHDYPLRPALIFPRFSPSADGGAAARAAGATGPCYNGTTEAAKGSARKEQGNRTYGRRPTTDDPPAVDLQGAPARCGRHLGFGHGRHQIDRRPVPAGLACGRALHSGRHHPGRPHAAKAQAHPQRRPSAERVGVGHVLVPVLLGELHRTHRHHRLEQRVSHIAVLRHHPVFGLGAARTAADALQHSGGARVRRGRGMRVVRRSGRILAAPRRPGHAFGPRSF